MKTIKIISFLDIQDDYLITTKLKRDNKVFLKQGSLDGACGPYCLFMALIILGKIDFDDASNFWVAQKSDDLILLARNMKKHDILFQSGTHFSDLKKMLKSSFGQSLTINTTEEKGNELIAFVVGELKNNRPTITGVRGTDLAHWLLAIGFEEDSDGNVSKLLFLDPSDNENAKYWNATIEVNNPLKNKKYKYNWVDYCGENKLVSFEEGISVGIKP